MFRYSVLLVFIAAVSFVFADEAKKSLIIVTTEQIRQNSQQLQAFITEKEARGFKVLLGTETQYGAAESTGIEKVIAIRQWLKIIQPGYSFLLLIGDPHPERNGIPMAVTWPLHAYPETGDGTTPTNTPVDTDMLYVNLSGSWDLNGNGLYGEHELDDGEGGISFHPDLIAGRIPVYDNNFEALDKILKKTISYMNMTENERVYRSRFLFPAGFYFFRGMGPMGDWDSAGLGEWALHNFLSPLSQVFTVTTMYEEEGFEHSVFPSTLPLNRENLITEWNKGTGIVFWGGHTFYNRILRIVWTDDTDGDNSAEKGEYTMPVLLNASDASLLETDSTGFLLSPNCNAGIVRQTGNFVQEFLGTAVVGIMGSTIASTPSFMKWDCFTCPFDKTSFGSDTAGIAALEALSANTYPAAAMLEAKELSGTDNSALTYANRMSFNWYGDPTLTLSSGAEEIIEDIDTTPDNTLTDNESTSESIPDKDIKTSGGGCAICAI